MTDRSLQVLREALTLSAEERAEVASGLLASLEGDDDLDEDPAEVEAAWVAEVESRALQVLAGEAVTEPWEVVRDRIARDLASR